ncbi:MAG TPA: TonB-dependent receptor [Bacteroidota bacterium]|nr:TonB-dependent receptor [Bacteroidota bacterium]
MALKTGILLLLVPLAAARGGGSIAGTVSSAGVGPLAGVNVRLAGTLRGTTSDAGGRYRIADVPAGTWTLLISLVGYRREERRGIAVEEGKETLVDVSMAPGTIETEQVVVTAAKREQSLSDVPLSVSVVDAAAIRSRNTVSLDDALRYVPGVTLTGTQVNVRGSSGYSLGAGSRVLMLLDGIPFLAGDTGEMNFETIPMEQVERIEVVKGASSALYGSSALGGVVNIITKPITGTPETVVRTYAGLYDRPTYGSWVWTDSPRLLNGESVSHTHSEGNLGVSLFASRQEDDGYRQNDERRRYNLLMKVREEREAAGALTLTFGLAYQEAGQFLYWRNIDSALIPPIRHASDNIRSTRYFVSGNEGIPLSGNAVLTVKGMWYHSDWGYQQTGDPERTESVSDGIRVEVMTTLIPGAGHTVTSGVEGNVDMIRGDMFGTRRLGSLALYAQDEAPLARSLTLTAGARCDLESVGLNAGGAVVTPKVALLFRPGGWPALRASYGEGFRVPSLPEAFVAAGSTGLLAVPNPDLKPERSRSYEAGVAGATGDLLSFDAAIFRSDITNLIEPGLTVSGGNLQLQWRNVTQARVQGVETTLEAALPGLGAACEAGYTYVYPEDVTQHDILKYRPRHVLHAGARWKGGCLSASADFRYSSRIERIDDQLVDAGVIPDGDQRVPIYVTDVRGAVEFTLGGVPLAASLIVNNVFQHNYVELIGNVMPPRTYMIAIESRL